MVIDTKHRASGDQGLEKIMKTINETGLAEIHAFLAENHKLGGDHFTPEMTAAWASDAEDAMADGNPPVIELKAWDSIHGRVQTYTITEAGIDTFEDDDA